MLNRLGACAIVALWLMSSGALAAEEVTLLDLFTPRFTGWSAVGAAEKPVVVAMDTIDNKIGYQFGGNLVKTTDRFTWHTRDLRLDLSQTPSVALAIHIRGLAAITGIDLEFQAGNGAYVLHLPAGKLEESWNDVVLKPSALTPYGTPAGLDRITQVRVHLNKKLSQTIQVVICDGNDPDQPQQ